MKWLLINPERLIHPPFGLLYVGSTLKSSGESVLVVELPYGLTPEGYEKLLNDEIKSFRPDIVGLTGMSMQAGVCRNLVKFLKKDHPSLPVVVGGVHATVDTLDVLSWGTDIVVKGEGENTALDIARYFKNELTLENIPGISYVRDGKAVHNKDRELIKDLNDIPQISYEILKKPRFKKRCYSVRGFWLRCGWIMTSRGCPGQCTFCASKTMHGRRVREFSVERVLDEVEYLKQHYGIEGMWMVDDTFCLKEKRIIAFCEGLKKRKIKLTWACQVRVDTFTENMAKAMKAAGCVQVDFGVESGSQRILDYVKKQITVDEIKRAFKIAKSNGLRVLATVIIGVPTETLDDINKTEELIKEIKPNFVAPFFLTPYPGTELLEIALDKKLIDLSGTINWQSTDEPVMKTDIPAEQLKQCYSRLLNYGGSTMMSYCFKPLFIWDMIKLFAGAPSELGKMIKYLVTGKSKDALNLFLYLFRKEMVNG